MVGGSALGLRAQTAVQQAAPATTPTIALDDIKPGMKGEWRTVVQGTALQTYHLEVLGIMKNFIGPQRSVIICQALDPSQIQNGPVAGMSGSPVYIEGKLAGAYAYGFLNPKDQAIIGVTPIDYMKEVLAVPSEPPLPGRPGPPSLADDSANGNAGSAVVTASADWRVTSGADRLGDLDVASTLRPLPTPIFSSGLSARTLAVFKDELAKRGLDVMQAPGGSASDTGPGPETLQPGSAIGVMLMTGDFSLGGVGTLTWREGDKLLAFGHPMFDFGQADMPLATAEVITVVRSYVRSFKLAQTGPVVGTISQDRATAIAGVIGPIPPMTDFHAHITDPDGAVRTFQGQMWQNKEYSPLIGAIALEESLQDTVQAQFEQTFHVGITLNVEGYPPIQLDQVASGDDGAASVAMDFLQRYDQLMNNPFEYPKVDSVNYDIRLENSWRMSTLEAVRVDSGPARAGGKLRVTVTFSNYRSEPTEQTVEIPIPNAAAGETLTLFLGDAAAADALDRGDDRRDFTNLADVINYLRQEHSRGALYVRLLGHTPGLRVAGASLPALPPSVEALYTSPKNVTDTDTMSRATIWETSLPVPGEFSGYHTMPIDVLP